MLVEIAHEGRTYFRESRTQVGYDSQQPFNSVLLYSRKPISNRIQLLDGDLDDVADAAEVTWLVGEVLTLG